MRNCSIQTCVTFWKRSHAKSTSCYLRLNTWKWIIIWQDHDHKIIIWQDHGYLAASTDYANWIFQQLSLMLKRTKLLWNKKHSDCVRTTWVSQWKKTCVFGKVFCFAQRQSVERVAENKNDAPAVSRFVKVQMSSTKIVSHRRQIFLVNRENY